MTTVTVNTPQHDFLQMPNKFRAFVGGFGSGKTWVGCQSQIMHYLKHPGVSQGYFAPTYPQIRDIFYPTIEEVAFTFGLDVKIRVSDKEVTVFNGSKEIGTTLCRSMDKPNTIVGFKIGRALVDEIDTMAIDKATNAWRKIIARLRYKEKGIQNGVDITTTPEGFNFVYQQFVGNDSDHYGIVRASTYENEKNLPDDYIQSMLDTYPEELIQAYLMGEFVNLQSGSVYKNYDRQKCGSKEVIKDNDTLLIGQDFNVYNMASVVYVKRGEIYHAVDELHGLADTPDMLATVAERYPKHRIIFYPDSSGKNRSSKGAALTDIRLIEDKYPCRYHNTNPMVKDRVLAMNIGFSKGYLKVNADKCPEFVKCLEQQAYDQNNEPDKKSGHDHMNDAGGYPIAYEMPISRPKSGVLNIKGLY